MGVRGGCHTPLLTSIPLDTHKNRQKKMIKRILSKETSTTWFHQKWLKQLRTCAQDIGLDYEPVPVRGWMHGRDLIACVRSLGGEIQPATPFHHWTIASESQPQETLDRYVEDLAVGNTTIEDFTGIVTIALDGTRFLALRVDHSIRYRFNESYTILAGPSLEDTLRLADRLTTAHRTLVSDTMRVFGTARVGFRNPRAVSEQDLVLPDQLRDDLFGYIDAFHEAVDRRTDLGIAASRGVLFVGAPGTGKTLTVRHLLGRFANWRRYLYLKSTIGHSSTFEEMVDDIATEDQPVLVIIEDLDRILESQGVTAEYLLNVLDGLLAPDAPVLWVATSNDPTGIDRNLLDRPGRFDRVFLFPRPEAPERRRLFEHYSPWAVPKATLSTLAAADVGLCGSHIREICHSAALFATDGASDYAEHLEREFKRMVDQHAASRRYGQQIASPNGVGFGAQAALRDSSQG